MAKRITIIETALRNWVCAFSKLSPQQQIYAQTAIDEVLVLAAKNRLHWNFVMHLKNPEKQMESEIIENEQLEETPTEQYNTIENEFGDCSTNGQNTLELCDDGMEFADCSTTDQNTLESCDAVMPEESQFDAKPGMWHCKECKQSFRSKTGLCNHMKKEHNVQKPFECDLCDAKCSDYTILSIHRAIHLGIKRFLCTICGKTFRTSTDLRKHNRSHTEERPFVCKFCQKSYKNSSTLYDHERTHSNVFAFTCNVCGKSFKKRGSWRDHCKIHNAEKPFSCEICGKSFRRSFLFKQHMQLHTGLKAYKCACSAEFAQFAGLSSHRVRCNIGRAVNNVEENTESNPC